MQLHCNLVWAGNSGLIITFSSFISDWGHPKKGCVDNSDKIKDGDEKNASNPCGGNTYTYYSVQVTKRKKVLKKRSIWSERANRRSWDRVLKKVQSYGLE